MISTICFLSRYKHLHCLSGRDCIDKATLGYMLYAVQPGVGFPDFSGIGPHPSESQVHCRMDPCFVCFGGGAEMNLRF